MRDTLGADDAAGLEAALEASGILDAWVSADGVVVHPRTNDVIVAAEVAADDGAPSLAGVLRPAIPANSPVHAGTVVALLSAIGWGEQAQRSTWVANDGRWRTGLLHGAWSKTAVEFLGAGARRETRRRHLERARAELAAAARGARVGAVAAAGAETQRDLIEALPTTMPSHALIDDGRRDVFTASGRWRWPPAVTTRSDGQPSRRGRRPTGSQSPWPIAPPPTACP